VTDTKQTKTVGEHWVCSSLARRGWVPALTRDGIERTDILAVGTTGDRPMVEIQVKTATGPGEKVSWHLGSTIDVVAVGNREWFVLVSGDPDPTLPLRSFVVPRTHVTAGAWISHMDWLTKPGIPPGQRNAPVQQARVALRVFARYEDRWELMRRPTDEAPVLLPPAYRALALEDRVGLPTEHPWRDRLPSW
jgi:hypothetical protein